MRNRTAIAIFLAFFMTVGFTALWSAEGDEQEGDVATNVVSLTVTDSRDILSPVEAGAGAPGFRPGASVC